MPQPAPAPYATPAVAPPPKISEAPDSAGRFGRFGGCFVPETLAVALQDVADAYRRIANDDRFWDELRDLCRNFAGRPTALYSAPHLSAAALKRSRSGDCAKLWLKREDLCHTGSHAIVNALGQAMLARSMGKSRLVASTRSGSHGVALATAATHLGLECSVYIASTDAQSRPSALARTRLLGATVTEVGAPVGIHADATVEAMRDWQADSERVHYAAGLATGPHPLPVIARDFHSAIGLETKAQSLRLLTKLPDALVANAAQEALGLFYSFVDDEKVQLVAVEAGGTGPRPDEHAAPLTHGSAGVAHGGFTLALQDEQGALTTTASIAAGLRTSAAAPELAHWKDIKRLRVASVSDAAALEAHALLAKTEGIIASLESAHALAEAIEVAGRLKSDQNVIVAIGARGDGDTPEIEKLRPA